MPFTNVDQLELLQRVLRTACLLDCLLGGKERGEEEEEGVGKRTTSMRISNGSPDHFFTSSVASWSAHLALSSSPK